MPQASPAGDLLAVGQRRRIYIPEEVAMHNCVEDIWITVLGNVYDLTPLIKAHMGPLAKPLLEQAGKDLSYLFDAKTGDPKTWVEPITNLTQYYLPCGRFIHVPPSGPDASWETIDKDAWWKSEKYQIGKLTKKTRKVTIVNALTKTSDVLTVGCEETMNEIQDRYLEHNTHAGSYTWKRLDDKKFVNLDMTLTLEENGIKDEGEDLEALSIDKDLYLPVLHIYFNDDLTVA